LRVGRGEATALARAGRRFRRESDEIGLKKRIIAAVEAN